MIFLKIYELGLTWNYLPKKQCQMALWWRSKFYSFIVTFMVNGWKWNCATLFSMKIHCVSFVKYLFHLWNLIELQSQYLENRQENQKDRQNSNQNHKKKNTRKKHRCPKRLTYEHLLSWYTEIALYLSRFFY